MEALIKLKQLTEAEQRLEDNFAATFPDSPDYVLLKVKIHLAWQRPVEEAIAMLEVYLEVYTTGPAVVVAELEVR